MAYEIRDFQQLIVLAAPGAFLWILMATRVAYRVTVQASAAGGEARSLLWDGLIVLGAAAALVGGLALLLPERPITRATFQTYAAPAA